MLRNKIITRDIVAVLDRARLSDRRAAYFLSTAVENLRENQLNISISFTQFKEGIYNFMRKLQIN